jgi:uncharacterized protein
VTISECIHDRIPSVEECNDLMRRYDMQQNIVEHSVQVMRVSLAITDNLKNKAKINRDLVIAASLLHDITKTRAIKTKEKHDESGGELLRELGFISIAEIVEHHVILKSFNPHGRLEEREIVYYADKRVAHDKIVTIEERVRDLIHRYGVTEGIRSLLSLQKSIEKKIAGYMKVDLQQSIDGIS